MFVYSAVSSLSDGRTAQRALHTSPSGRPVHYDSNSTSPGSLSHAAITA